MLEQFLKWPKLIWSSIYEKIAEKAKKANTSVKEYLGDDSNIDHITNVVYEGIPFFFKFSLKQEAFNEKFKKHFKSFRDKMYSYDDELNAEKNQKAEAKLPEDWKHVKEAFNDIDSQIKKTEQIQALEDWEKSQEIFKSRAETRDDAIEVFNSKDYPNGISPEEVHAKINAMIDQTKNGTQGQTTRIQLLNEWKESQKLFDERAKSINNPEELAKMTHFTSDMSEEEILEKFLNVVSESRANTSEKKKVVKTKVSKVSSEKSKTVRTPRKKKTEE